MGRDWVGPFIMALADNGDMVLEEEEEAPATAPWK